MYDFRKFFIDGAWVEPKGRRELDVINPASEEVVGKILQGTAADVDAATQAARRAFESFSQTSRQERMAILERIIKIFQTNMPRLAKAISDEMGAPMKLALPAQAGSGQFASRPPTSPAPERGRPAARHCRRRVHKSVSP